VNISIIQSRLDSYNCKTAQEEENAIREIAQEIVLSGLSRAGFFKKAAFQGGTCLRVIYGIERFSEDLDFVLMETGEKFELEKYTGAMREELKMYGFEFTLGNRSDADSAVQKQFIKDNSAVKLIAFKHFKPGADTRSVKIKLEIDTNPPHGGKTEVKYLDYPFAFEVVVQDIESLFAGKCHALLCREYVKGRDWYDFAWYVSRKAGINFTLLSAAINQVGPWEGKDLNIGKTWCVENLRKRVAEIDWEKARDDVKRFLKPHELPSVELWNANFFNDRIDKLAQYLA